MSDARNGLVKAEFLIERAERDVTRGVEGAEAKRTQAEAAAVAAGLQFASAVEELESWKTFSGLVAALIGIFMLIDAALLPGFTRRRAAIEGEGPLVESPHYYAEAPTDVDSAAAPLVARAIDTLSGWTGNFIAYWSIIAVFVYYYEVLARYVFNSPTNWAHEGMFLMFGMQYLISGAFAYREDAHVRVDVIYTHFSPRGKAITDIITSVFFFIFAITLFWTGWIFMMDSFAVREVSFNEWGIQYWPVKITISLGAALILLQGISKLLKDVAVLRRGTA